MVDAVFLSCDGEDERTGVVNVDGNGHGSGEDMFHNRRKGRKGHGRLLIRHHQGEMDGAVFGGGIVP